MCAKLQNEKNCNIGKIVRIRSDHGKEFEKHYLCYFCDKYGIVHEFSALKTPQQNGVVERNIVLCRSCPMCCWIVRNYRRDFESKQ